MKSRDLEMSARWRHRSKVTTDSERPTRVIFDVRCNFSHVCHGLLAVAEKSTFSMSFSQYKNLT